MVVELLSDVDIYGSKLKGSLSILKGENGSETTDFVELILNKNFDIDYPIGEAFVSEEKIIGDEYYNSAKVVMKSEELLRPLSLDTEKIQYGYYPQSIYTGDINVNSLKEKMILSIVYNDNFTIEDLPVYQDSEDGSLYIFLNVDSKKTQASKLCVLKLEPIIWIVDHENELFITEKRILPIGDACSKEFIENYLVDDFLPNIQKASFLINPNGFDTRISHDDKRLMKTLFNMLRK